MPVITLHLWYHYSSYKMLYTLRPLHHGHREVITRSATVEAVDPLVAVSPHMPQAQHIEDVQDLPHQLRQRQVNNITCLRAIPPKCRVFRKQKGLIKPLHIFAAARPQQAQQSAPFALGGIPTMSEYATAPKLSMEERPEFAGAKTVDSSACPPDHSCAPTGSVLLDALSPTILFATSAQGASNGTMEPRAALELRKHSTLTPYHHKAWRVALEQLNLTSRYPNLCHNIQFGFNAGIIPPKYTYTPLNHTSVETYPYVYEEIEIKEFQKGRYIGPFTQNELEHIIGPFQTSPLSIIPKPGKPGKFRAVHNFSSPHTPLSFAASINSQINSDNFPCTWGTFNTVAFIIFHLPPGSRASIRDVAEAYRTIPITPEQWAGLVIRLRGEDRFAVNICNNFGLSSAGGLYGQLADAGADIFRALGIGPLSKWVDDHIFFAIPRQYLVEYNNVRQKWHQLIKKNGGRRCDGSRIWFCGGEMEGGYLSEFDEDNSNDLRDLSCATSDSQLCYSDADIDRVSDVLGIPWEPSKTIPFSPVVPYLGFNWDLDAKIVALPDSKKEKYLGSIFEWQGRHTHTLAQLQSLYGKLLHSCLIIREGRAYLTSLESMLSIFHDRPFVPRTAPQGTSEDLEWWKKRLGQPHIFRDIPGPAVLTDFQAFSDASSGVGIGIVIGQRWRAWRLLPGWKSEGRDIGWAESIAFEFLVQTLCQFIRSSSQQHLKVFGDNRGVVEGWWKGRSRNKPTNETFRRVHAFTKKQHITIYSRYVASKLNPADNPSRGIYGQFSLLLPPIAIPEKLQSLVIDFNAERNFCELQAVKNGTVQGPSPKPESPYSYDERQLLNQHQEWENELAYLANENFDHFG